jgi:hypothetical protein
VKLSVLDECGGSVLGGHQGRTASKGLFTVWRRGWNSARPLRELPADRPLYGCLGRTGFESPDHTRREIKNGATRAPFSISGGEGGMAASRRRRRLRRCSARTGSSSSAALGRKTEMGPARGPISVFWRRGWDSNPRYGRTVHLISSQAHSTTLAPLLNSAFSFGKTPCVRRATALRSGRVRPIRPLWHLSVAALRDGDFTQMSQTLTAWTTTKTVKSAHSARPATVQRGDQLPVHTVKLKGCN